MSLPESSFPVLPVPSVPDPDLADLSGASEAKHPPPAHRGTECILPVIPFASVSVQLCPRLLYRLPLRRVAAQRIDKEKAAKATGPSSSGRARFSTVTYCARTTHPSNTPNLAANPLRCLDLSSFSGTGRAVTATPPTNHPVAPVCPCLVASRPPLAYTSLDAVLAQRYPPFSTGPSPDPDPGVRPWPWTWPALVSTTTNSSSCTGIRTYRQLFRSLCVLVDGHHQLLTNPPSPT
ncbi:hypothetical protein CORC01_00489 [Colletotrichum orchidophilum]|uniref:Uncharacterized protein n=1 Tax=Colletotrichum orchidophilum TaxID=1209926 RepID=A0A1G4BRY9_9PEZI|nr:uncharacterized protein CORC01_00489 [Colletotrichum orchidophilum]OHF04150.1 hypothetical protein CORC01_00489 [Colletotrichum orchidophilum]